MTVLLVLVGFVVGVVGGSLVTHRLHRQHICQIEELELKAGMCDWFRDAADRLVDQLDAAEHALRRRRAQRGAP